MTEYGGPHLTERPLKSVSVLQSLQYMQSGNGNSLMAG